MSVEVKDFQPQQKLIETGQRPSLEAVEWMQRVIEKLEDLEARVTALEP